MNPRTQCAQTQPTDIQIVKLCPLECYVVNETKPSPRPTNPSPFFADEPESPRPTNPRPFLPMNPRTRADPTRARVADEPENSVCANSAHRHKDRKTVSPGMLRRHRNEANPAPNEPDPVLPINPRTRAERTRERLRNEPESDCGTNPRATAERTRERLRNDIYNVVKTGFTSRAKRTQW
jgi:hypothetical protein